MEESAGGSGEIEQDINTRDSHRRVSDMEATTSGPHPPAPEAFHSADEDGAELQPFTSNADGLPASAWRNSKAIVVQGPDGALYVGNMNSVFLESKTETSGKADTTQIDQASAPFDFGEPEDLFFIRISLSPSLSSAQYPHECHMNAESMVYLGWVVCRDRSVCASIPIAGELFEPLEKTNRSKPMIRMPVLTCPVTLRATRQRLPRTGPLLVWMLSTSSCTTRPPLPTP